MPKLYPKEAGFSMTGSALLPDSTIEQIATCGERVDTLPNLQRRARWFLIGEVKVENRCRFRCRFTNDSDVIHKSELLQNRHQL
jgi:hypothetical protein